MGVTAVLILAAGEGKRMKTGQPKVLQQILFKPMINWVIDSAASADIDKIFVVEGHLHEQLSEYLESTYGSLVNTILQEQQLGTGHAVMRAAEELRKLGEGDVAVLCGDAPFISSGILKRSYNAHVSGKNALTVLTAEAGNPYGYGRILRDPDGSLEGIVEEKDATDSQKQICEINSGVYWFHIPALLRALTELKNNNAQGEYYLTDIVTIFRERGCKCGVYKLDSMEDMAAANDRTQLLELNRIAKKAVLEKLMSDGVAVYDDSGIIISPDAEIGRDTVILPGTIIRGKVKIGENCTIGPNSLIDNCVFGDNVVFNASQAYHSTVENGATIGPFAHLRPNSILKAGVHVGDFVEIKNSVIGEGSKVPHLTYVGDSDVGKRVNFGCGSVTVNYDGINKHRTVIGDNVFIGCNTNLVAPVKVSDNVYTAAGSTITKNVPENALAVARSRQSNIEGWVARKRPPKE